MAIMVAVSVAGAWFWLGQEALSELFIPAVLAFVFFSLLARVVERVEDRIVALEEKIKQDRL
jgi:predicted PurR-regulated permease PerM